MVSSGYQRVDNGRKKKEEKKAYHAPAYFHALEGMWLCTFSPGYLLLSGHFSTHSDETMNSK
jgi:hypothetical protein